MARSYDYLRELGLELVVDVLEGAAEGGELLARFLGDEHLGHAVPVDRLAGLHRHIDHLLRAVAAHILRPAAASSLGLLGPADTPLSSSRRRRRRAAFRPDNEMGIRGWPGAARGVARVQTGEYFVGSNRPVGWAETVLVLRSLGWAVYHA